MQKLFGVFLFPGKVFQVPLSAEARYRPVLFLLLLLLLFLLSSPISSPVVRYRIGDKSWGKKSVRGVPFSLFPIKARSLGETSAESIFWILPLHSSLRGRQTPLKSKPVGVSALTQKPHSLSSSSSYNSFPPHFILEFGTLSKNRPFLFLPFPPPPWFFLPPTSRTWNPPRKIWDLFPLPPLLKGILTHYAIEGQIEFSIYVFPSFLFLFKQSVGQCFASPLPPLFTWGLYVRLRAPPSLSLPSSLKGPLLSPAFSPAPRRPEKATNTTTAKINLLHSPRFRS